MTDSHLQHILTKVYESQTPELEDLVNLLSLTDPHQVAQLYAFADKVRKEYVGDGILIRGIIEFSSNCRNTCRYCGLNKNNTSLLRYRLTKEEILSSVSSIVQHNIKTVVLQSGEDDDLSPDWLADVIREIKQHFNIAITLSTGEWPREHYELWKRAGADRFLLKIESANRQLYNKFHPDMSFDKRVQCLKHLKQLGYQLGSGTLVGLKGQTPTDLANDILFFQKTGCVMLGIGLFIPHGQTDLAAEKQGELASTLKMTAVTRIVLKTAHLPATTATGSIDSSDKRIDALKAGANVIMPNFTPQPYRSMYQIYPNKRCNNENTQLCNKTLETMAKSINRHIDYSLGHALT